MSTTTPAIPTHLSDRDLLARLSLLAGRERETTAELVAHLAELESRPAAYAAHGYGSLFAYCTQALRFSEDAACARIEVARTCRRFPMILERLASGAMSLTSARLLGPHLTPENHLAVLEKATGRTRREIEVLIAHLAPRPDAASSVRKLPNAVRRLSDEAHAHPDAAPPAPSMAQAATCVAPEAAVPTAAVHPSVPASARPALEPTAPERYRLQCTIGEATHERLRRLQALLRREIPDGDPATIIDRALVLLLAQVEARKLGRTRGAIPARSIRPGTDGDIGTPAHGDVRTPAHGDIRTPVVPSRHIPRMVRRAVWTRDGGQCAFVASGRRCTERAFLEFHHVQPYARQGPATIDNISLRCRRHNHYEAELVFGARPAEGRNAGVRPSVSRRDAGRGSEEDRAEAMPA